MIEHIHADGVAGSGTAFGVMIFAELNAAIVAQVGSNNAAASVTDDDLNGYGAVMAETVVNVSNRNRSWYALITGGSGSPTVSANFGSSSVGVINVSAWRNVDLELGPIPQTNTGTGFNAQPSTGSITPTDAGALIVATCVTENQGADPLSSDGALAEVVTTSRGNNTPSSGSIQSMLWSSGAVAADFALNSSTNWACQVFGFKPLAATIEQGSYRFFKDDAGEAASTPQAAENTRIVADTQKRVRVAIISNGDPGSISPQLDWQKDGSSSWTKV